MKTKVLTHLLALFAIMFTLSLSAQTKQDILTNETVTMLHKKGLGAGIIVNKIKTSKTTFDVSTDALIKLKEDGIPDEVVSAMIESADKNKVEVVNLNDPLSKHRSGIYYFNPSDTSKTLSRIDPTVVSSGKTGGLGQAMAYQYSYGISQIKATSVLSGPNAHKQVSGNAVTFYFYFERGNTQLNQVGAMNWWFATASSPNEFALVKTIQKKESRTFDTGSANAYGSSVGVEEKQKIRFSYVEVADGIFKVTINGDLKPGEYCFIYTGATPSMYSNDKVFDFGTY
jgi:hypothetical protein